MSVEIKGQQIRIRVKNPKLFSKFKVHNVGKKGRLQRVAAFSKKTGWTTQGWRINLKGYKKLKSVAMQVKRLRVPKPRKVKAVRLAMKYFKKRGKK
jgi:hypothetical protein